MYKNLVLCLVLGSAVALGGCASKSKRDSSAGLDSSATDSGLSTSGANDRVAPAQQVGGRDDDTSGLSLSERTIYFEFDSSDLSPEGQAIAANFARYLIANPTKKLRLEGHADERGTREYNVGLGERRANAVLNALRQGGASASQVSIVSYGEERPADPRHDEEGWARNRRVEIVQI